MSDIHRYLVEVLPADHTLPMPYDSHAYRGTCLSCGYAIPMFRSLSRLPEHKCSETPTPLFATTSDHWRVVARDAFLAGRDAEAIEIICHEMNLVSL